MLISKDPWHLHEILRLLSIYLLKKKKNPMMLFYPHMPGRLDKMLKAIQPADWLVMQSFQQLCHQQTDLCAHVAFGYGIY